MKQIEIRHAHMFCGLGGGKKGFNRGKARVGTLEAKPRCIGGFDSDANAIRKFNAMGPGRPGTVIDLFSREQYIAFHGKEPLPGWREATTADIHAGLGNERPNVWFLSAPCKGFSGLLSETRSVSPKYQALNQLTLRGIWLALEAFKDDPVDVILFENVPRIATRGRYLLDQIVGLLRAYGYAVAETTHDCGELGGLAQSRKRFLLIARHAEKVPPFIYEPIKRPLRAVGEVLSKLPLPGHPAGGGMHRMPALQWKTWVRLAFVEAGSDWRSLERLRVQDGVLQDYLLLPQLYNGAYGVKEWVESAGTVTSKNQPSSGAASVADPRFDPGNYDANQYGVMGMDETAGTVINVHAPGQGRFSVADPMVRGHDKSVQLGVRRWDQVAGVVTGKMFAGGGPNSVADPRIKRTGFANVYRVVRWEEIGPAVTTGGHPSAGGSAVADPRTGFGPATHHNVLHVATFDRHAKTVTGAKHPSGGAQRVADPRVGYGKDSHRNKLAVVGWHEKSKTVTGATQVQGGALSVADPRPPHREDYDARKYRVTGFDETAGAVIGASSTGNGAFAVADPGIRLNKAGSGPYGVVPWTDNSQAILGSGDLHNSFSSVADPRLPDALDRLVALIIAPDNTWHRPFTTLELAALQSLIDPDEYFPTDPLVAREIEEFERSLWMPQSKHSDTEWREHIGNAVPPEAAEAMSGVIYRAIIGAIAGETFTLSSAPVWVRPIAIALSVNTPGGIA